MFSVDLDYGYFCLTSVKAMFGQPWTMIVFNLTQLTCFWLTSTRIIFGRHQSCFFAFRALFDKPRSRLCFVDLDQVVDQSLLELYLVNLVLSYF